MKQYIPVIGLEIHVELKTESGMFCQCKINQFDAEPNSHVCPVCLGLPGALPVPNKKAIEWTIKIGQALNCTINKHTKFDRKHYSYPDLPKGYQISQYDEPIAVNGKLQIFSKEYLMPNTTNSQSPISNTQLPKLKEFRIHRVHLEEDTGKLIHKGSDTLIDFNRSGTPLVEIVTEADFTSSDDVKMFLEELHTIIRYLDVSDADMEKGTMRMEPNISVREIDVIASGSEAISNKIATSPPAPRNDKLPPYKVEVKNINSFNFVKRAIDYEVKRHIVLLEKGETPIQETRGWDSNHNKTYSQRTKEEAHDYRYFPEPDIPPFEFNDEYIEEIKKTVPELPKEKMYRYIEVFKLRPIDAYTLTRDLNTCEYFEHALNLSLRAPKGRGNPIGIASSPSTDAQGPRNDMGQAIANLIINKKISTELTAEEFVKEANELLKPKETDTKLLDEFATKVIASNEKSVADYKAGKQNAIMFLVGQVLREMKGKADAQAVISTLKQMLK